MPTESTWMLEKRVIYFRIYGNVTGADVVETMKVQMQHHEEGTAPVHTIIDLQSPVINVPSLAQLRQVGSVPLHPNTGWMVMLGGTKSIVSFAVSVIIQLSGSKNYKVAKTLEEAIEFLTHNDPTLNLPLEVAQAYIDHRTSLTS